MSELDPLLQSCIARYEDGPATGHVVTMHESVMFLMVQKYALNLLDAAADAALGCGEGDPRKTVYDAFDKLAERISLAKINFEEK